MNIFVFAVLVLAVAVGSIDAKSSKKEKRDIADDVKKVISEVISYIPDPIAITDLNIVFPATVLFRGGFNITEISLSGLKALDIEQLTYGNNTSLLQWKLNFKDIVSIIDTSLEIKGLFANIENHFSIRTDFKDFSIEGQATLADDQKGLSDFNILMNLKESVFDIKGFLDNDKLSADISKVLTQNVAKVFDGIATKVSPIASRVIKTIINIYWKFKG